MPEERRSLVELEMRGDFVRRHIGPGEQQITGKVTAGSSRCESATYRSWTS